MKFTKESPAYQRLLELGRLGLSNEEIHAVLLTEFPDLKVSVKTVANRLQEAGIKTRSALVIIKPVEREERLRLDKEIQRLKDENAQLRKQVTEALREANFRDAFLQAVRSALEALPPLPTDPVPLPKTKGKRQDAVLAICCLHFGEYVSPAEMGGFGGYDIDLACARWQLCVESAIDLLCRHHQAEGIETLYVVDLGDNISGMIHDELAETNSLPIGRQVVLAAHLLSLGIRDLASAVPKVKFIGVPGNHPRLYRKPRFKNKAADNFDTLVYEQIALECSRLRNVEVHVSPSFFHIQNIRGFNFWFAHGDNIRGWAGIPYYGFDRAEARYGEFLSRSQLSIDYWVWGNFHTAAATQKPRGARIMTGSFKGPDEFALGAIHTGSDPIQVLFGVHEDRGRTFHYDINLARADPRVHNRYLFPTDSSLLSLAKEAGLL
jgi:hypothetical protein